MGLSSCSLVFTMLNVPRNGVECRVISYYFEDWFLSWNKVLEVVGLQSVWHAKIQVEGWIGSALPSDVWAALCRVLTLFWCARTQMCFTEHQTHQWSGGCSSNFPGSAGAMWTVSVVNGRYPMQGQWGQGRMRRGYSNRGWKKSLLCFWGVWNPKSLFPLWILSV